MAAGTGPGSSAAAFSEFAECPSGNVKIVSSASKKRAREAAKKQPPKSPQKPSLPKALQIPPINPALTLPFRVGLNYFASFLPGGRETMMGLARLADRQNVQHVAMLYEELSADRRETFVIEELCKAAEVSPTDFISAVTAVAYSVNMDISRLLASLAQPEVVQAAIERSKNLEGGHADRKMLLQAQKFLPVGSVNISQKQVAVAGAQANAEASGPSFEDILRQSAEAVRG